MRIFFCRDMGSLELDHGGGGGTKVFIPVAVLETEKDCYTKKSRYYGQDDVPHSKRALESF